MAYTIIQRPAIHGSFTPRPNGRSITALVMHSTGGVEAGDIWTLRGNDPNNPVSVPYYVTRSGVIYQFVQDRDIAWHAGVSFYQGQSDWNTFSLGIELENLNTGTQPYPQVQMDAAVWLARTLVQQYRLPRTRLVKHAQIAQPPGRRSDPVTPFPWDRFVEQVYAPVVPQYIVTANGVRLRTGPSTQSAQADFGDGPVYLWEGFVFDVPETVRGEQITLNGITSNEWRHWVDSTTGAQNGFVWAGLTQPVTP